MTVQPRRLDTPADLAAAMGASWEASEQQWAAITAPLAPAVVIAGAGSGKTTLMAARVVYLVLTGQVRPDQVLGLTFTTKAASQLRAQIRQALTDAGALGRLRTRGRGRPGAHRLDLQRLRRRPAHRPRAADRARAGHPGHHRRCALPARCAGGGPAHRRGRAPERPPQDRHPEPPRPRRPDERAPGRGRRRAAGRRRGARPVPGGCGGGATGQEPVDVRRCDGEGRKRHRAPRRAARTWLPATGG